MSAPLNDPRKSVFKTYDALEKIDGNLADTTPVTFYLRDPRDGTVTTPAVVHEDTGVYSYTLPNDVPGLWMGRWVATGAVATSSLTWALSVNEAWPPALIGLDDARAELNFTATTDDDELQGYIYTASAILLNHPAYRVGDVCQVNTYTDEEHDGGGDTIVLDHYPVTSVTTVTEYGPAAQVIAAEPLGSTYTGYGYRLNANAGILTRTSGGVPYRWCGPVLVTYTAGNASVPWEIRQACLALIDHLWATQRGTEGSPPSGLEAESLAGSFGDVYGPSFALPNRVKEMLENYRKAPAVA